MYKGGIKRMPRQKLISWQQLISPSLSPYFHLILYCRALWEFGIFVVVVSRGEGIRVNTILLCEFGNRPLWVVFPVRLWTISKIARTTCEGHGVKCGPELLAARHGDSVRESVGEGGPLAYISSPQGSRPRTLTNWGWITSSLHPPDLCFNPPDSGASGCYQQQTRHERVKKCSLENLIGWLSV